MIKIQNVTKKFKNFVALDEINLEFEKGLIHGIIGRNGSGKTVLMKCICGLMYVDAGKIIIDEKVLGKDIEIPKNLGIIIETPGFLDSCSGYRNLKMLADINKKADKQKIRDTINFVGLDATSKKHVSKYSLGMKQRLAIAQAIMEDPEILVLDEPMNGLDNQGVEDMRELFLKLKSQGKTIILASHNKEDISILCDTITELDRGKVT